MAFEIPRFNRAARISELMDKKLVDRHLERMDAHGISRRDFVQVVGGGIAAGMAAELMGVPVSAYA
jgi:Leu/Phe-tRNA-protein transferase